MIFAVNSSCCNVVNGSAIRWSVKSISCMRVKVHSVYLLFPLVTHSSHTEKNLRSMLLIDTDGYSTNFNFKSRGNCNVIVHSLSFFNDYNFELLEKSPDTLRKGCDPCTSGECKAWLDAVNYARSTVEPPAAAMEEVVSWHFNSNTFFLFFMINTNFRGIVQKFLMFNLL